MSRYTKDRWARAFKLHKFPEIGNMKPSEMMLQMKDLLPTDSNPGMYFMAAFLLRLPSDMIDHIISKDFKDCTKMAEYADLLYSSRRGRRQHKLRGGHQHRLRCEEWQSPLKIEQHFSRQPQSILHFPMVEKSFSPWKEAFIFPPSRKIFLSVECETFNIPPHLNSLDFSSMGEEKNKQQ
jgi:hypothetical protein